ncbi:hypothetical protein F511_14524 [Dorcoceras hygrometricum]|uniref:Uncharacterized protein n=1 Tax=Dorcoceras hygrometricum TaxID=472368 RepID=A0A2Z7BUT4_9LAMI|nr:hypothetical protein F511_14524 [Dorcoceras hygrometricum]
MGVIALIVCLLVVNAGQPSRSAKRMRHRFEVQVTRGSLILENASTIAPAGFVGGNALLLELSVLRRCSRSGAGGAEEETTTLASAVVGEESILRMGLRVDQVNSKHTMALEEKNRAELKQQPAERKPVGNGAKLGNKLRAQKCSRAGDLLREIYKPARLQTKAGENITMAEQISSRAVANERRRREHLTAHERNQLEEDTS